MRNSFLALALVLNVFIAQPGLSAPDGRAPAVGNHLPPLEFTDLQGRDRRLDWVSTSAKATLIFFFDPQCGECFKEMVYVDVLLRHAADYGLEAYAVEGSGLMASEADEVLEKYRGIYGEPAFPIVIDPGYRLSGDLGVTRLPSSLLMERHGVIISRSERFEDADAVVLTSKIERLLQVEKGTFDIALQKLGMEGQTARENDEPSQEPAPPSPPPAESASRLDTGDTVPPFEFTDLDGSKRRWEPSTGDSRVTILFFWGALCLPCIQEMAFLNEIYSATRDFGLEIIAVEASGLGTGKTKEVMERYRRFHPMPSYPIVPDPDFRLSRLMGVEGKIPATYFVDGRGQITHFTDEFIQVHEKSLTGRIELALSLETGSLDNLHAPWRDDTMALADADEVPSIRAKMIVKEEFRTRLAEGDACYRKSEYDKALPHYLRCLELEPDHVSVRERVARIHQRRGRLEEALVHWEAIQRLEPSHPDASIRIESLLEQGVNRTPSPRSY